MGGRRRQIHTVLLHVLCQMKFGIYVTVGFVLVQWTTMSWLIILNSSLVPISIMRVIVYGKVFGSRWCGVFRSIEIGLFLIMQRKWWIVPSWLNWFLEFLEDLQKLQWRKRERMALIELWIPWRCMIGRERDWLGHITWARWRRWLKCLS